VCFLNRNAIINRIATKLEIEEVSGKLKTENQENQEKSHGILQNFLKCLKPILGFKKIQHA